MIRIGIIIILLLSSLGVFSQALVKDPSFQPVFDIRTGFGSGCITDIWENPNNGNCFATGSFDFTAPNQATHDGLTSFKNDGANNLYYNGIVSISQKSAIKNIDDSTLLIIENGFYLPINLQGTLLNLNWRLNLSKTVKCKSGFSPYFFPDGSSLMANTINNTGKPCDIINPPDTFPGRHIVKVDPQGLWDSTFTHDANRAPRGFAPYDSNRILVYGFPFRFTHYDSVKVDGLCRIYLDGTLDTTFHSPLSDGFDAGAFNPVSMEEDGGFFLQGRFKLKGDTSYSIIVRLNQDGSIDSSYNFQNGPKDTTGYGGGASITTAKDGGYIIFGLFNKYQGHIVNCIVKVDSSGIIEPQYFNGFGPDSSAIGPNVPHVINKVLPSAFGGYYVVGDFLKWDGQPSQPIIRLTDLSVGAKESREYREKSIEIYPNPTENRITLNSTTKIEVIEVCNLLGERVKQVQSLNTYQHILNLQELDNGLYFLKVKVGEQWISKKIIKQ